MVTYYRLQPTMDLFPLCGMPPKDVHSHTIFLFPFRQNHQCQLTTIPCQTIDTIQIMIFQINDVQWIQQITVMDQRGQVIHMGQIQTMVIQADRDMSPGHNRTRIHIITPNEML